MASTINATTSSGIVATADNTGQLALQAAGTTSATFNTFGIGLGSATPSSGIGITFPAAQSASSDANTLDDYEEGTWTPTVIPGTSGSVTYNQQTGRYTKIGNMVYIQLYIYFSKNTASGNFNIGNLPFAPVADSGVYGPVVNIYYSGFTTALTGLTGYLSPGATSFGVRGNAAASTNTDTIRQFSDLGASCDLIWFLVYRTS